MPYSDQAIANKLLVAMPDAGSGFFESSVVLMLEHNKEGAMGLTLTQAATLTIDGLLKNLEISVTTDCQRLEQNIMIGGPVQPDRGFILHNGNRAWQNTTRLSPYLSLTVSLDFLTDLANDAVSEAFEIFLGYAGWGAGQLEQELRDGHWLFAEATHEIMFELPPEARWQAAFNTLGFDINRLSRVVGHA